MIIAPIATDIQASIVIEGVATLAKAEGRPYMPDPIILPTTMLIAVISPISRLRDELLEFNFVFLEITDKNSQSFL